MLLKDINGTILVQFTFKNGTCTGVRNAETNKMMGSITICGVLYHRNQVYKTWNGANASAKPNSLLTFADVKRHYEIKA